MEELILDKAKDLFFSYGIKSVSMDDLARQAGVSKKTIYQFFSDKNALINKIIDKLIQCHTELYKRCNQMAKDPVDEVLKHSHESFHTWTIVNHTFFFELRKTFFMAWNKLEQHKQEFVRPGIIRNLEQGMKQGLYRELDLAFTADIRLRQLQDALEPASFTPRRVNPAGLIDKFTMFYLHSITTDKGNRLLNKYLKNKNEKPNT